MKTVDYLKYFCF